MLISGQHIRSHIGAFLFGNAVVAVLVVVAFGRDSSLVYILPTALCLATLGGLLSLPLALALRRLIYGRTYHEDD